MQFFCSPFLLHGVTNVNCILFSKVEFFNHMLIHWQMDRILLPVLFLLYTSNAYKSQRGFWGYVCSCSHCEIELRAHKDPSDLSGLSRNTSVCVCMSMNVWHWVGLSLDTCSQLWLDGLTMDYATAVGDNSCYVQPGWKLPWDIMKAAFPEKGSAGGFDVWDPEKSSDWTN